MSWFFILLIYICYMDRDLCAELSYSNTFFRHLFVCLLVKEGGRRYEGVLLLKMFMVFCGTFLFFSDTTIMNINNFPKISQFVFIIIVVLLSFGSPFILVDSDLIDSEKFASHEGLLPSFSLHYYFVYFFIR